MPDNTIVCRCEDISLAEIRELIARGITSIDEIKRLTRAGMGPCQGRGCRQIIAQEIARATGRSMDEISMPKFRPLVVPVKLGAFIGGDGQDA